MDNCSVSPTGLWNTDFIRLMIGDLDGSCSDCIHGDEIGQIPIIVDNDSEFFNSKIRIPLSNKLHALTLNLNTDNGLEIYDIESNLPYVDYNFINGILKVVWTDISNEMLGFDSEDQLIELTISTNGGSLSLSENGN